MEQPDFARFRDLMTGMGRVFGASVDTVILDVYWLALRGWTLAEFEGAASHLLSTAQFMPKPADFTQLRKAATEIASSEAWTQVCALVASGTEAQRQALPARVQRVVRAMGGWRQLEMADTATRHFREKRFAEIWDELGEIDEACETLPGVARLNGTTALKTLLPERQ